MLSTILLGILADQISKIVMTQVLSDGKTIDLLGNWLQFYFVKNYGAAFGLGENQSGLFFAFALVGIPLFGFMLLKNINNSIWGSFGYAFVISGALGNAIDRAYFATEFYNGYVRDFISLRGFAIFNVADMLLNVGAALVVASLLFIDKDALLRKKQKKVEEDVKG